MLRSFCSSGCEDKEETKKGNKDPDNNQLDKMTIYKLDLVFEQARGNNHGHPEHYEEFAKERQGRRVIRQVWEHEVHQLTWHDTWRYREIDASPLGRPLWLQSALRHYSVPSFSGHLARW